MTPTEAFTWEVSHNGFGSCVEGKAECHIQCYGTWAEVTIVSPNEIFDDELDTTRYMVSHDVERNLPVSILCTIGRHLSNVELYSKIARRNYRSDMGTNVTFTSRMLHAAYASIIRK